MTRGLKLTYTWHLNEDILNSLKALEKLRKETKDYFKANLGSEVKIQNFWDGYKAVLRGVLINLNYEHKKEREKY